MPAIVHRIPPTPTFKRERVAVYCRVSSRKESQDSSLDLQISYFQDYVKSKSFRWELVGFYVDRKPGRSIKERPEFQRLLRDCEDGKIDMILVKSIARFGRDTLETMRTLERLRELNVDVYFDLEELHSLNGANIHLITVLEAAAQAENEARSENIKWGIRQSVKDPLSKIYSRACYGYRQGDDGFLVICEDEAKIVRDIFVMYLNGYSVLAIVRALERNGIKSPTGKERWCKKTIDNILGNEKYIGNAIIFKTFVAEYPSNKRITNRGQKMQMQRENGHPPIISKEMFEQVAAERVRRSNVERTADGVKRKSDHYSMKARLSQNSAEHNEE